MSESAKVKLARELATKAHMGQFDKGGRPYIEHPLWVSRHVNTDEERIVALLHDVVEDTNVTIDTIRNLFGDEIADAVQCLTHKKDEPYLGAYIERISKNRLARHVKMADLEHNMDLSRLPVVTEKDTERIEKYTKARAILAAADV